MTLIPAGDNIFHSASGNGTLVFRNPDSARTSVSSVETSKGPDIDTVFRTKPEDNAKMALALLGIGRVTSHIEALANDAMRGGRTVDDLLRFAVINLRAAILLKEEQERASGQDLDDAYALYKLSYPKSTVVRSEFDALSLSTFWVSNLKNIRKDPTVLGAL